MALSGGQTTTVTPGGPGAAYAGFTAKASATAAVPAERLTRLAVGGPGRAYAGFTAKAAGEEPEGAAPGNRYRGFILNVGRLGKR